MLCDKAHYCSPALPYATFITEVQVVDNALIRCAAAAKLERDAIRKRSLEIQMENNKLKMKWKMKCEIITTCTNVASTPLCMGCAPR